MDPQKLATNSLKFQVTKNGPKVLGDTAWQDFSTPAKFSTHFNNRVRIDELGADFGGEVPRAEGVGGGKPPPPVKVLTRTSRRIFRVPWAPFWTPNID